MTASTVATAEPLRAREHGLALSLGVARRTPPQVRVPSVAQRAVPGRSPLEASGWADVAD